VNIVTIPVIMVAVTGAWFTWGGIIDMIDLFRRLRKERINPLDDGFVVDHQNRDEIAAPVVTGAAKNKETPPRIGHSS
jgi:SSS family solute:Na+ symporter